MKRRGFLAGLLFAPAIIRTPGLLMPVRPVDLSPGPSIWLVSWSSMPSIIEIAPPWHGHSAYDSFNRIAREHFRPRNKNLLLRTT